jgi:flagellar basal body-associated protein FliL
MDRRQLIALIAVGAAAAPASALAAAGAKKDEKKKGGGLSFIQIPTLTATILRRGGGRGVVTVESGVDIADAALRDRAEKSMPRLRSAFNGLLQQYVSGLSPGSPVNADYLAQALQRQTDTVLGKRGAKLLLGSILMN